MDKVRLGRALGYGTRHAAKTLAAVAEAASAPAPRQSPASPETAQPRTAAPKTAQAAPVRPTRAAKVVTQRGKFKSSVWRPLAAFSSVVSLQVSGTFFALLAATFGTAAWRTGVAHPGSGTPERSHLVLLIAVALLFTYFAVSNFWKAQRRSNKA